MIHNVCMILIASFLGIIMVILIGEAIRSYIERKMYKREIKTSLNGYDEGFSKGWDACHKCYKYDKED